MDPINTRNVSYLFFSNRQKHRRYEQEAFIRSLALESLTGTFAFSMVVEDLEAAQAS